MPITPATSQYSQDGEIIVKAVGALHDYRFRLLDKNGDVVENWSAAESDNRSKIYRNLKAGTYTVQLSISTDPSELNCVTSKVFNVPALCEDGFDECNCKFALRVDALEEQHVQFQNLSQINYNDPFKRYKLGETNLSFEGWVYVRELTSMATVYGFDGDTTISDSGAIDVWINRADGVFDSGKVEISIRDAANELKLYLNDPILEIDTFYHIAVSINAVRDGSSNLDENRIKLFINGSEYSTGLGNLSTTDSFPYSSWNLNNWRGYIYEGQNPTVASPDTTNIYYITNFRVYKRDLRRNEVTNNYMLGCHAQPSNCSSLILNAPTLQENGQVVKEVAFNNNGTLRNYSEESTKSKGGAWIYICCPVVNDQKNFNCCVQDCDEEFALTEFEFLNTAELNSFIYISLNGGRNCAVPERVDPSNPLQFEVTTDTTIQDQIAELVDNINTYASSNNLKIIAEKNVNTLIIKHQLPENDFICSKSFVVCNYNRTGTSEFDYVYTATASPLNVMYPRTQTTICCLPDPDCCPPEEALKDAVPTI